LRPPSLGCAATAANRLGVGALRQWALVAGSVLFNFGAGLKCSVAGLNRARTLLVAAGVRWLRIWERVF
jgi:hypothetical protein